MQQLLAQLKSFFSGVRPTPHVQQLTEQLKSVSITGRMAYAITCLEIIIRVENLSQEDFQPLLDTLWNFTSNPDLSDWEELVMPFIPDSEFKGLKQIFTVPQSLPLYQSLSPALLACVDEVIEVGRGNLYAGMITHSPATLESTLRVADYLINNNYSLPLMENFQRSPFTLEDQHGWGKRVNRAFFQ